MEPNPYESPRAYAIAVAAVSSPWIRFPLAVLSSHIAFVHALALVAWIVTPDIVGAGVIVASAVACLVGTVAFAAVTLGLVSRRMQVVKAGLALVAVEAVIQVCLLLWEASNG